MSVRIRTPLQSLDRVVRRCVAALEGLAFWSSVALPLAYPPLLAAAALSDLGPTVVVGVAVANTTALLVGHGYRPGSRDGTASETDDLAAGREVRG